MKERRLSRRALLRFGGTLVISFGGLGLLTACGASAPQAPTSAAPTPAPAAPKPSAASASPAASPAAPSAAPSVIASASPAAAAAPAAGAASGPPTGTLRLAMSEQPESLDPAMSLQILNFGISLSIFDSLVSVDTNNAVQGRLATKWDNPDPQTWRFTLRPGVKFHDGTPFTSASVKASLDRITDPAQKSPQKSIFNTYVSTETPDDLTAVIKTNQPTATLLRNLALTAIVPANPSKPLNESPIGTGPFKFVEWQVDDHMTLAANPDYWGGPPRSAQLLFRSIKEITTRITALTNGEVDLIDGIPAEQQPSIQSNSQLKLIRQPTNYQRFLWMNASRKPFDDVRVRQAMQHAVDVQTLVNDIMAGDATLATGCLAQGTFGYSQQTMPAYDPEQTKSMLAQAGYANGFSVELKTADYLPKQREIGDTIVAQLAEVGVNATLNDQDQAAWIKDLLALNWDMELIGTGALNGDGDYALGRLYMSTAKRTGWSSSEMDSILQQEEAQLDPTQRQQEFDSACKLLLDQGPTIFLFNSVQDYGLRSNVQGFVPRVDQILFLKDVGVS